MLKISKYWLLTFLLFTCLSFAIAADGIKKEKGSEILSQRQTLFLQSGAKNQKAGHEDIAAFNYREAFSPLSSEGKDGMELIEHVYDSTVTYSSGRFDHHQEETTFSTLPRRTEEAHQQRVFIYEKTPQELKREKILMKAIQGRDGRVHIPQTTKWPYNICTQISMRFDDGLSGGSGCLVGPHHVLTCGHNVYDSEKKTWAEEISVRPALNDEIAPFGEAQVVKVFTFKGWTSEEDPTLDMALLVLNKSIGRYTGWGGLLSNDEMKLSQETVHVTGYPGDKGCKQMWSMSHKIKIIKPEQFDYEIDTYPGQSGSPIWINNYGIPMILGVHTLGTNSINSGVRLSMKKFTNFVDVISKTYVLHTSDVPPVPPVIPDDEQILARFLNGRLVYKPNTNDDVGKIELHVRDLKNPFDGTFDLSQCKYRNDEGKDVNDGDYLSISTGYRKKKKNAAKVEIWFAPRFLIKRELATTAGHFREIYNEWAPNAGVGIFWTWGGRDILTDYNYLTSENLSELSNTNLYEKYQKSSGCGEGLDTRKNKNSAPSRSDKYPLYGVSCKFKFIL